MLNIIGLLVGGFVAVFVTLFIAAVPSDPTGRSLFMDGGGPSWPWFVFVSLPVGTAIGYLVGKKVAGFRNK